jgi:hypothetical protein
VPSREARQVKLSRGNFSPGMLVVLWADPGGYATDRTERRFSPRDLAGYESSKAKSNEIAAPVRAQARHPRGAECS